MWLMCEVDDISKVGRNKVEYKEIEGILFRDDSGKERRFKVKAVLSETTARFREMMPDVDWDENNIHVSILVSKEVLL